MIFTRTSFSIPEARVTQTLADFEIHEPSSSDDASYGYLSLICVL
jgi:hypothetical protein